MSEDLKPVPVPVPVPVPEWATNNKKLAQLIWDELRKECCVTGLRAVHILMVSEDQVQKVAKAISVDMIH